MSPRARLYTRVGKFKMFNLSGKGRSFMPGSCLVALLCTLSTASICFFYMVTIYMRHIPNGT